MHTWLCARDYEYITISICNSDIVVFHGCQQQPRHRMGSKPSSRHLISATRQSSQWHCLRAQFEVHVQVAPMGTTLRTLDPTMEHWWVEVEIESRRKNGHRRWRLLRSNKHTKWINPITHSHHLVYFWPLRVYHTHDTHQIHFLCLLCFVFTSFSWLPLFYILCCHGCLCSTKSSMVSGLLRY